MKKSSVQLADDLIHGQTPLTLLKTNLPVACKVLYPVLWTYVFRELEDTELRQIAKECSIGMRTARRALRLLEEAGWVETRPGQTYGSANIYTLHNPGQGGRGVGQGGRGVGQGGRGVGQGGRVKPLIDLRPKTGEGETAAAPQLEQLTLPPSLPPMAPPQGPKKRAGRVLDQQDLVDRVHIPDLGVPAGWEGWRASVAAATGKPWAWEGRQVLAAENLNRLVEPTALPGWQSNFLKAAYPKTRGFDLELGVQDVNKYMPDLRPPKQNPPAAAPVPQGPIEPLDLEDAAAKLRAAAAEGYARELKGVARV
jgi:Bacterial regulatory proteins, gntR family